MAWERGYGLAPNIRNRYSICSSHLYFTVNVVTFFNIKSKKTTEQTPENKQQYMFESLQEVTKEDLLESVSAVSY